MKKHPSPKLLFLLFLGLLFQGCGVSFSTTLYKDGSASMVLASGPDPIPDKYSVVFEPANTAIKAADMKIVKGAIADLAAGLTDATPHLWSAEPSASALKTGLSAAVVVVLGGVTPVFQRMLKIN